MRNRTVKRAGLLRRAFPDIFPPLIVFLTVGAIFSLSFPLTARERKAPVADHVSVPGLLEALDSLFAKKKEKDDLPAEVYRLTRTKMRDGQLTLEINPLSPPDIFSGIGFTSAYGARKLPAIVFSPYLLELAVRHPSLVYAALLHEFKHASDFFIRGAEFDAAHGNEFDRYIFEMDANYAEALFIRDYIVPAGFRLSLYEKIVLASLKNDNLETLSATMMNRDMKVAYALKRITASRAPPARRLQRIRRLGTDLLRAYRLFPIRNRRDRVQRILPLVTYRRFVPALRLEEGDRRIDPSGDTILRRHLLTMDALIEAEGPLLENYQRDLRERINRSLR